MVNTQCSLLWPRHQPSNEATEKLLVVAKIADIAAASADDKNGSNSRQQQQQQKTLILPFRFVQYSVMHFTFYKNPFDSG